MNLTPPPAATAPNLQALREAYRRDKAALVATLFAPLPTAVSYTHLTLPTSDLV